MSQLLSAQPTPTCPFLFVIYLKVYIQLPQIPTVLSTVLNMNIYFSLYKSLVLILCTSSRAYIRASETIRLSRQGFSVRFNRTINPLAITKEVGLMGVIEDDFITLYVDDLFLYISEPKHIYSQSSGLKKKGYDTFIQYLCNKGPVTSINRSVWVKAAKRQVHIFGCLGYM